MSRKRQNAVVSGGAVPPAAPIQPGTKVEVLGGVMRPSHNQLMTMIDALSNARLAGRRKLMGLHWWVLLHLYHECSNGRTGGRGVSVSTLIKELNKRRRVLEGA